MAKDTSEYSVMDHLSERPVFIVLAFRYGTHSNVFPIGVFLSRSKAEDAARSHYAYRGFKYKHRIYEFVVDKWDDDVGHLGNCKPCIEDL
jgi:hypothetical protein